MIANIAESHGDSMIYDSHTPGGARLADHSSNPQVLVKIKKKSWDFVVFQEQSQYPGFSTKQLHKDVYPYAKRLAKVAKKVHPHASVVFYMTMARRNGDPDNRHISSELLTYEGMQERVNRCYRELAKNNGALIAPVGEVWKDIRESEPDISLYSDDVHPNKTGTYLAACVFYAVLFNSSPVDSYIPSQVNSSTAQYIQEVVDIIAEVNEWDWRE